MSLDVVVCTKDRPRQLQQCISMIKRLAPHQKLWIFDGTEKLDYFMFAQLAEQYKFNLCHVPNYKLGHARATALIMSQADYVAMIDDDLIIDEQWFPTLMKEFADSCVVAANGKIIYGSGIISKLFNSSNRLSGSSGGATIYDRKAILALGNFNKDIHRGEDTELLLRVAKAKKKWVKTPEATAHHPLTMKEFLDRPKLNVCGWKFIMKYSPHKLRFILTRFGAIFAMPIYYLWRTGDPRCSGIWFIYKLKALLYYLLGSYTT